MSIYLLSIPFCSITVLFFPKFHSFLICLNLICRFLNVYGEWEKFLFLSFFHYPPFSPLYCLTRSTSRVCTVYHLLDFQTNAIHGH